MDVGLLVVEGAIFHQVPRRAARSDAGSPDSPILSTSESALEARLQGYLRDQIVGTFSEAAQPIECDTDLESPVPPIVTAALNASPIDIVQPFHPLPALLLDVQAHNSPEGLFAVVRGACGPTPVVALLKVEQERGLSFDTQFGDDGTVRIEVAVEEGLVLTSKTHVFKAAVFWFDEAQILRGFVTDDQTGSVYRGPSSDFWLAKFLGCRYSTAADILTRSWVKATERTIRSDIKDAKQKDVVLSAMLAELGSNRGAINARKFITDYVPEDAQDLAIQRLRDAGVPVRTFSKSRDVASQAPSSKHYAFDNGVKVTTPATFQPELSSQTVDGTRVDVLTVRGRLRDVL